MGDALRKSEKSQALTYALLRELLDYDPETGLFRWRVSRGRAAAGSIAGTRAHHGYISISIFGRLYYAHRLAWLWMTGEWPAVEIDHKDTHTGNNAWLNLRPASHAQNMRNSGMPRNNSTGFKGVIQLGSQFRAQIRVNRRHHHLGFFPTAELAHAAYREASARLHGEFGRVA